MVAAYMGLAGFDPMEFLTNEDQGKADVMQLVSRAATEIRERENENLAIMIANKVREMLGGR
jgi:hypothetical protein